MLARGCAAGYPSTATAIRKRQGVAENLMPLQCGLLYPQAMELYAHPRLQSRDADTVREFLRGKHLDFEIIGRSAARAPVDTHINALDMPDGSYLSYVQYGAPVRTQSKVAAAHYRIQFALHGACETALGKRRHACAGNNAVIASPGGLCGLRLRADCKRVLAVFSRDALARQLSVLLGAPLRSELVFQPDLDTSRGVGRTLVEYLRLALREFNRTDSALHFPIAIREFEQLFMTMLLLGHRHNYSALLHGRPAAVAPRDVKRAVDYIHANLDAPITLADLVSVCGVPGRTLRQHFNHFKGMAPMAYLRRARLAEVRADLQRRDGRTVTTIARRWGFEHMGRFAAGYRRLFGEPPSKTR
jgi:AraC-like DNA-binding protein